ncbi:hypothetical protein Tco_1447002 [Tanacetum coccineum]
MGRGYWSRKLDSNGTMLRGTEGIVNQKSAAKVQLFLMKVYIARVATLDTTGGHKAVAGNPPNILYRIKGIFNSGCFLAYELDNSPDLQIIMKLMVDWLPFGRSPIGGENYWQQGFDLCFPCKALQSCWSTFMALSGLVHQKLKGCSADDSLVKRYENQQMRVNEMVIEKEREELQIRGDKIVQDLRAKLDIFLVQQKACYVNDLPTDPLMSDLEDTTDLLNTGIFSGAYDDKDIGAEADLNNLETTMIVSTIPQTRIHKDLPKELKS